MRQEGGNNKEEGRGKREEIPSGECAGEKEGQRAYGREKLKEKNRGDGEGKKDSTWTKG